MTRRLEFAKADIHYLANLCHGCGACLHACQYAPPHEFAVNVPRAMARVRARDLRRVRLAAVLRRALRAQRPHRRPGVGGEPGRSSWRSPLALQRPLLDRPLAGNFYAVFPHSLLAWIFGPCSSTPCWRSRSGATRFCRDISTGPASAPALGEATRSVLGLRYLDGGHGDGCNDEDDAFTLRRRRFHHLTFYGFLLCFAATCVATLYHYGLGERAPYPLLSLPVLLGTLGGIGLLVGPAGLLWLNWRRDPAHREDSQNAMDRGFIALLLLASATGLALLAGRDSGAMALWLAIHLGVVMALFLTLPYGKFAHGVFRSAALVKWAIEKRQPSALKLGDDA